MFYKFYKCHTAVMVLALFATVPAQATPSDKNPEKKEVKKEKESIFANFSRLAVGTAVINRPDFIGAEDNQTDIFPFFQGQYNFSDRDAVYLRGINIGYSHQASSNVQLGIEGKSRSSRNEDDDPRLNGIGDVDTAFEVSPWIKGTIKGFSVKGSVDFDVSGNHDGFVAGARVSRKVSDFIGTVPAKSFEIYADTSWGSSNFMDTYFDVTPAQAAASSRAVFDADAGFYRAGIGSVFQFALHKDVYLRLDGQLQFLLGDAKDTNVTFENTSMNGFIGVGYTF